MARALAIPLLLGTLGCVSPSLVVRLEGGGRSVEGPPGELRLALEPGRELRIRAVALDVRSVRIEAQVLRDGLVVDEPELTVEVGGSAGFPARFESAPASPALLAASCPPAARAAPAGPDPAVPVRISYRLTR